MRHNIALIAVKRYLSNVLTDYEKQKSISLFLGEFQPDPVNLANSLWNDDAMLPYPDSQADVSAEKALLFPLLTGRQLMALPLGSLLREEKAFREEKTIVLGSEQPAEEESVAAEKEEGASAVLKKPAQEGPIGLDDLEPSNINFLQHFREMDKTQPFVFIGQ